MYHLVHQLVGVVEAALPASAAATLVTIVAIAIGIYRIVGKY